LVTGAEVIGTLPITATFPDQPSPYAPASRRAWNELFVDLTRAPGWEGELPIPSGDPLWVDYDGAAAEVRSALAKYASAVAEMPQIMAQIEAFGAANPEMVRYAAFRATCDRYGRNWRAWSGSAAGYPERIHYHLTAQWLATEQLFDLSNRLRQRGQHLYLDLPIGCHPDGVSGPSHWVSSRRI
jgi:4-alpha-glucanotransferase